MDIKRISAERNLLLPEANWYPARHSKKKGDTGIIKLIQKDKNTTKPSFKFPRAGVISSDGLFCPTNGPEPKDSLTIIGDKEKQKTLHLKRWDQPVLDILLYKREETIDYHDSWQFISY